MVERTKEEALDRFNQTMMKLTENGIRLKKEKFKFTQKEMLYLGYRINEEGTKPHGEKIKPTLGSRRSTSAEEVKRFLGAMTFYHKFIKTFSRVAPPLNELPKNNVRFRSTKDCERGFEGIGIENSIDFYAPVLKHYDSDKKLTVISSSLMEVQNSGPPEFKTLRSWNCTRSGKE